ncbi:winged helix-turn-helix domain-containing protein [Methylobacterium oryzisoli]|uniref:winged helix-turn-helix domain-containing protein n=1 Tax=Methylobacterium oryzisoli TaxID=3385502 RepID=UPI0038922EE8
MFLTEAEAEARLDELRRQRAALDRAIAEHELYLDLGRRLRPALPAASPAPAPEAADRPEGQPEGRPEGRRVIEAAFEVLAGAGRPMHAAEIWEALAARGLTLPGHDPVAALNTRLWKRAQGRTALRRLGDGVYALDAG